LEEPVPAAMARSLLIVFYLAGWQRVAQIDGQYFWVVLLLFLFW
jgi:hypothetical protein